MQESFRAGADEFLTKPFMLYTDGVTEAQDRKGNLFGTAAPP
jgi:hypothetical protein